MSKCRFAEEVAVGLCPCDDIISYETVVCKEEGDNFNGFDLAMKKLTSGGVPLLVIVACWLRMSACDLDMHFVVFSGVFHNI